MSGCEVWDGGTDRKGLPQARIGGRTRSVRRVVLERALGRELRCGEVAFAKCGNRACVSPEHLDVRTKNHHRVNLHDKEFFLALFGEPGDSCWEWSLATIGRGYGRGYGYVSDHGKTRTAHRVSYEALNGPIPGGMVCMHTCDNPSCVNPLHLRIGTQEDNIKDMISKGRSNPFGRYAEVAI